MGKNFTTTVHKDLGEKETKETRFGPTFVKAQIINYGDEKRPGPKGLNIQAFWTDEDGELQYGKRPLLTLDLLKWIQEEDMISKAIAFLEAEQE